MGAFAPAGYLTTEPRRREDLSRVAYIPAGSNAQRTSCMVSRSSSLNMRGIYAALSTPTPCSPVIDPPCWIQRSRIAPLTFSAESPAPSMESSNRTRGCRLPSPAWKTLAIRTPDDCRELCDRAENFWKRGPRDDAVLNDVIGADPTHGGEGRLSPLPDQRALLGINGHPYFECAVLSAVRFHRIEFVLDIGSCAIDFDDQDGTGTCGVVAADCGLCGLDGQGVHHLDGSRHDACRDDRRGGRTGVVSRFETGQDGTHFLGRACQTEYPPT